MESYPSFIRSPVVPRFNSPFPPLHPDKKYRGVYERAGFDVYKGDYNTHKHSHDPNHPSECNSMGKNSPSPTTNAKFSRNFSAPNPFGDKNLPSHRSDPNLSTKRFSNSSKSSHQMKQRNFSESSNVTNPYKSIPTSASLTNFNYASLYSTPVVDSTIDKNEDIKLNNFVTPVKEKFDDNDRNLILQDNSMKFDDPPMDSPDTHSLDAHQHESSPEKSFHSVEDEIHVPIVEDSIGSKMLDNEDNEFQSPTPMDFSAAGHYGRNTIDTTDSYDLNNYQQQTNRYNSNNDNYDPNADLDFGLHLKRNDSFKFGHDSVTSTYSDRAFNQQVPRLSELIEEEVGATPRVVMPEAQFDNEFFDASNESNENFHTTPAIVVEDTTYNNVDDSDVDDDDAKHKKPTQSTYFNRDQAYDLLTGGGIPERTPNLPSAEFSYKENDGVNRRSLSTGPDENYEDVTDPATETTATTNSLQSFTQQPNNRFSFDKDNLMSPRNLRDSQLYESGLSPEIKQELEGRFFHHKISLSPQTNLDSNIEAPLIFQDSVKETPILEETEKFFNEAGSGPCRKCGLEINGKSIWSKDGQLSGQWHRNCFGCQLCFKPFNKGTNCYVIDDNPYCEQHFHELNDSICKTCGLGVEGACLENEKTEKFHPQCLTCSKCNCFIDKDYFVVDGSPLCENDGLIELEREKQLLLDSVGTSTRIEKRRTRLLHI